MELNYTKTVLKWISYERDVQDNKWGGADHDDQHSQEEWINLIKNQLDLALCVEEGRPQYIIFIERMVKVAALSVAAIESTIRKRVSTVEKELYAMLRK